MFFNQISYWIDKYDIPLPRKSFLYIYRLNEKSLVKERTDEILKMQISAHFLRYHYIFYINKYMYKNMKKYIK